MELGAHSALYSDTALLADRLKALRAVQRLRVLRETSASSALKLFSVRSLADEGEDQFAAVRLGTVLEQEDTLPGSELEPAFGDRDRQLHLGQRRLEMRRHVVRPLVVVAIAGRVFGGQPAQERVEVAQHVRRVILLYQQRRRGVDDEHGQQAAPDALSLGPG